MASFHNQVVTITSGTSLSSAATYRGYDWGLCGIVMPAAWDAANITVQASHDGGTTFTNVFNASGTEVTVTAAAGRYIALDPKDLVSATGIKLRSGTSGAPVNQTATRVLQLVFRRFA